jgi:cobalt-zinc-cadmium efflux system membrane fusion protein
VGWLSLADRSRAEIILPSAAVLLSEDGPAVLVPARGPAGVERRPVRLGQSPDGLAVVLSGLEENERVVVRGAFFLDAERRRMSSSGVPGG